MRDYCKGFGVSFLLHGAVAGLVLWFTFGGVPDEKELLLVDFSTVSVGSPHEGGSRPGTASGQGVSSSTGIAPEPVSASAPAPHPEQPREPELPKAVPPQPEQPSPKPVSAKKIVAAKKTPPTPAAPASQPQTLSQPVHSLDGGAGESQVPGGDQMSGRGTPGGRGSGAGSGAGTRDGLAQGYVKANFNYILVRIRRNLQYPDYARRARLTGTARFAFVIKEDGTIAGLRLEESSGHAELDKAAEKAIRRAGPFPNPPMPALLIVPIGFRLS